MNVTSGQNSFRVSLARAIFLLRSGRFRELFNAFKRKVIEADSSDENERYKKWITKNETNAHIEELKNWYSNSQEQPLVTFVLKDTSDPELTSRTLNSIESQIYKRWEVLRETENNVNGRWVVPVTAGDTLTPTALAEAVRLSEKNPNLDLIYSDHDRIDDSGNRLDPFFKPGWSPEFLQSTPYIGRLAFYKKDLILNSPLFWKDEETWLKQLSEKRLRAERIPKILYHFRELPSYVAVKKNVSSANSSVSILIPTRDQPVKLKCAVNSILEKTTHRDFEIVILNNASVDKEMLRYFEECKSKSRIKIFDFDRPFNFSAINNFGVSKVSTDYVVFLNDDTELITPDWLQEMLEFCNRSEIGAVGAKLLNRDRTIQHGGILIGLPEIAIHAHRGWPSDSAGYRRRLKSVQNFSAVTAACMMMRREVFQEINGFDEKLALAYNDVDLCMRLRINGYRIVWTPYAQLFHDESSSRGYEQTLEKQKRLSDETDYFVGLWKTQLEAGDPYYNPNLILSNGAFQIRT